MVADAAASAVYATPDSRCAKAATMKSRAVGGPAQGDEGRASGQFQARAVADKGEAAAEDVDEDPPPAEDGDHGCLGVGRN